MSMDFGPAVRTIKPLRCAGACLARARPLAPLQRWAKPVVSLH